MNDAKINLDPFLGGQISVQGNDLETEDGLQTAVLVSLFTDARLPDDIQPDDGGEDRRGWWPDHLGEGHSYGSLLWTLDRSKQNEFTRFRAEEFARNSLLWLVEEKIAAAVEVTAQFVRRGVLGLSIDIKRPRGDLVKYRYDYIWQAMTAEGN